MPRFRSMSAVRWGTPLATRACSRRPRHSRACSIRSNTLTSISGSSRPSPNPRAISGDPASDHAIWARHDPTELAGRLNGVRLFVSAGNGRPGPLDTSAQGNDRIESTVLRESRAFVRRLQQLHTPVQADFYGPGTHAWPYWQRELERALPALLQALTGPDPKLAR